MQNSATFPKERLIVAMTGASGVIYGVRLLQLLRNSGIETHLIMSRNAHLTLACETELKPADIENLACVVHSNQNLGAACSSGSFRTLGIIIAPCSIKTMSEIASGVTTNLISRAADVGLKERRRVVLMLRETPLHLGHIRSMAAATECGAIIYPPVPAFYARPNSLQEMVDYTLARVLDLFDIHLDIEGRWAGIQGRHERVRAGD
jgi:flavin prenyltransferase